MLQHNSIYYKILCRESETLHHNCISYVQFHTAKR